MKSDLGPILFIGKRMDAISAASSLGLEVHVLSFKKPKFKSKRFIEHVYSGDPKSFQNHPYRAIIPLTEMSVPIADEIIKLNPLKDHHKFSLCHDKYQMKLHAKENRISLTDFILIDETTTADVILEKLGLPLVLKKRDSSGSRGLKICNTAEEVQTHFAFNLIAEKYIQGKELSVESFVQNGNVIFSNITEYHTHHHCNILPYHQSQDIDNQLLSLNKKIIENFKIQNGITHVEFYQTRNDFIFGEIAIRPPGGYIMKLLELAYGFNPWKALIQLECGQKPVINDQHLFIAGAWIIHPGEKHIDEEPNFISVLSDPNLVDIKCSLKPEMQIKKREGSGEDYGRILLKSNDYNSLLNSIKKIKHII